MIADVVDCPDKEIFFLLFFRRRPANRLQLLRVEVILDNRQGPFIAVYEALRETELGHHFTDGLETVVRIFGHGF